MNVPFCSVSSSAPSSAVLRHVGQDSQKSELCFELPALHSGQKESKSLVDKRLGAGGVEPREAFSFAMGGRHPAI